MTKSTKSVLVFLTAILMVAAMACGSESPADTPTPAAAAAAAAPTETASADASCGPEDADGEHTGETSCALTDDFEMTAAIASTLTEFPDFVLRRAGGESVRFSDYLGRHPVNVVFYRGFF